MPATTIIAKRFINPFTDFGFKKIFGEENNKEFLIDFLNELLGVDIVNLTYLKTEKLGLAEVDRKAIYTLYCENRIGEKFIVELQRAKQKPNLQICVSPINFKLDYKKTISSF